MSHLSGAISVYALCVPLQSVDECCLYSRDTVSLPMRSGGLLLYLRRGSVNVHKKIMAAQLSAQTVPDFVICDAVYGTHLTSADCLGVAANLPQSPNAVLFSVDHPFQLPFLPFTMNYG